jgi:hypothetical protein
LFTFSNLLGATSSASIRKRQQQKTMSILSFYLLYFGSQDYQSNNQKVKYKNHYNKAKTDLDLVLLKTKIPILSVFSSKIEHTEKAPYNWDDNQ